MHKRKTTRWRRVVLDSFDEAMISFALVDKHPQMKIVNEIHYLRQARLHEWPALVRTGHRDATLYLLFPDNDEWSPEFSTEPPNHDFFRLVNAPRHHVLYRRGGWEWGARYGEKPKWSFSFPTPTCGDLIVEYDRENESDRAFVQDVWRVLNRLMTNRMKSELPHLGVVYDAKVRAGTWAGHHVLEWCAQVYDRMIDGRLRPMDSWVAPDTPWHRELRARVVAQFGHELDEPKEPEGRYHEGPWATDISRGFSVGRK